MVLNTAKCTGVDCAQTGAVIRYRTLSQDAASTTIVGEWWCPLHDPGLPYDVPEGFREFIG